MKNILRIPICTHKDQSTKFLDEFLAICDEAGIPYDTATWDDVTPLLRGVFAHSPFLTTCVLKEPGLVANLITHGPDTAITEIISATKALCSGRHQEADLMRMLRVHKRRAALTIAWADLSGQWSLIEITEAISAFAEASVSAATAFALRHTAGRGAFDLVNEEYPEIGSGFIVIGMGKLGASELNYSSDIDLICLFDPERIKTAKPEDLQKRMVRMTRTMARILDERTVDGYVFRVDLRLRPDPSSTPLAMSVLAAEAYYESLGQNWERAAMIKARVIAGDVDAGDAFLCNLRPFVWRRSLDFAAIQDIHSIKRQIHAHKGGGEIATLGHNIKTGRGGIRDIEFFAQTQQLIWGGREPALRARRTLDAISNLVDQGQVTPTALDELSSAYEFLRCVEHRLQMLCDEQTQTLPSEESAFSDFAAFCGYATMQAFSDDLKKYLHIANHHYGGLFEDSPTLTNPDVDGNLAFTGVDTDPETLSTISKMGFTDPSRIDAALRGWHRGRVRAMRSTRARQILTELTPTILSAFAQQPNPDTSFNRFDTFLSALPAGVQLFSMFQANPELLELLAEVMGQAPRLAEHLGRRPYLLDGVLAIDFYDPLPSLDVLIDDCRSGMIDAVFFEDKLDLVRRWNSDRRFQVGIQIMRGVINPSAAALHFSEIAEAALRTLVPEVMTDFAERHGKIENSEFAILAFGKMGSQEMTPESDLDLVFVYDIPDREARSDGARPLPFSQYFGRLGQRIISAITSLTAEGRLYEVDMRLRPAGNKGPLAAAFEAFVRYYDEEAWTWEYMALTRARTVYGNSDFCHRVMSEIHRFAAKPRDKAQTSMAVHDMRRRMAQAHIAKSPWDLKHVAGGQIDVDFLVQFFHLMMPSEDGETGPRNSLDMITAANAYGIIDDADAHALIEAKRTYRDLQTFLALFLGNTNDDPGPRLSKRLKKQISNLCGQNDFDAVEPHLIALQANVRAIFNRTLDGNMLPSPKSPDP